MVERSDIAQKRPIYSPFSLTWLMTNDFQVEFFSFNYRKQRKLSVCKKVINQVRVNGLYFRANRPGQNFQIHLSGKKAKIHEKR